MKRVVLRGRSGLGRVWGLGVGLAMAGLIGGCSVAALPPTSGGAASVSAGASATGSASTSSLSTDASASIGAAPTGAWTSLRWTDEHTAFPQTPVPATSGGAVQVNIFGWSSGYVGFRAVYDLNSETSPMVAMISTASSDGVHWSAGRPIDVTGFTEPILVTQVLQGPSGLLALGRYMGMACGGPSTVDALWTSPDGLAWTPVTPPADFASASVYTVDGGSLGFIATGTLKDGVTQAIWLSTDGRSWRRTSVPTVTTGTFELNGATSVTSGFVVGGAVLGDEGCGGPRLLTPSLWRSATGSDWTRVELPGATPANDATMKVTRINDRVVMAVATEWNDPAPTDSPLALKPHAQTVVANPSQIVWVSSNGQDWKLVASPSTLLQDQVITDGRRGLVVEMSDGPNAPTIATVADDLTVTALSQTGAVPGVSSPEVAPNWTYAVGPTGMLCIANDGSGLWLGTPNA